MKILFITDNFPPEHNAIANRVWEMARYWVAWGHEVTVITCAPNFPRGELFPGYRNRWWQWEERDGIRVLRVKTYMAPNRGVVRRTLDFLSFGFMATLAGWCVKRPDVVTATSPQFFSAVAGWLVSVGKWRPFVFELGDLWPASVRAVGAVRQGMVIRLVEKLELFLYRRSARVLALTEYFKQDLVERGIAEDKVAVVYNGLEPSRFELAGQPPEVFSHRPRIVVGYIGTHGMAHRLDNLLDAAERLDPDAVGILMLGDGAERPRLLERAERMNLRNLRMEGPVPAREVARWWAAVDVALVHLRDDPVMKTVAPTKLLEAIVLGKPVVLVAPEGEASGLLAEVNCGVHVPPEDPDALAAVLERISRDPEQLARWAENARAAAPRFYMERCAERVLEVYEGVRS